MKKTIITILIFFLLVSASSLVSATESLTLLVSFNKDTNVQYWGNGDYSRNGTYYARTHHYNGHYAFNVYYTSNQTTVNGWIDLANFGQCLLKFSNANDTVLYYSVSDVSDIDVYQYNISADTSYKLYDHTNAYEDNYDIDVSFDDKYIATSIANRGGNQRELIIYNRETDTVNKTISNSGSKTYYVAFQQEDNYYLAYSRSDQVCLFNCETETYVLSNLSGSNLGKVSYGDEIIAVSTTDSDIYILDETDLTTERTLSSNGNIGHDFDSTGSYFATGTGNLYATSTWSIIRTFTVASNTYNYIEISNDGSGVVSCSNTPSDHYWYYFYYDGDLTSPQEDPDPNDPCAYYDDLYGTDLYVEFFYNWEDCYYKVNDFPTIVYTLPCNSSATEYSDNWYWNISLYYLGTVADPFSTSNELIAYRTIGCGDCVIGTNYLGKFPYEGLYEIRVYNVTTLESQHLQPANNSIEHISDSIRVCGVGVGNTYRVTITPQQEIYFVNDTVDIKIDRLTGDEYWGYSFIDPQFGNTREQGGFLTANTVIIDNVTFVDYLDYYYWAEGIWKLDVFDQYDQTNKMTVNIDVRIEEVYSPYDLEEYNFWLGLGLILVFLFIGIGISTKLESESQLGVILLFGVIGGMIASFYSLVPLYFPFLIGLLLIGYIVSGLFGRRVA